MPDIFKPIFHWKLHLRWLANANEIYTNNMKCTCLKHKPNPCVPNANYIPLLALWLVLGVQGFALGAQRIMLSVRGFALGPQGYSDPDMLVWAMRKSRVGGIVICKTST